MVLWLMRQMVEDYEGKKPLDHEKLKFLSEVYKNEKFVSHLHFLVHVLTRKVALKAEDQEQIWFLRGRIYQLQTLNRNLKEAHKKKLAIERDLKKTNE